MATPDDWANGYARQASADFQAWQAVQSTDGVCTCHKMLFLQMACEKLCKAHLIRGGTPAEALQTSHGYIANPLPVIIRQQIITLRQNLQGMDGVLTFTRHIAGEIEVLNPPVTRNNQRRDNCEYPWENGNEVLRSPLDWSFNPSRLLVERNGRTFLKLIQAAITQLVGNP